MSTENNNTNENENQNDNKQEANNDNNKNENNNTNKQNEKIDLKDLPSYEYFQRTVQKEIQLGLMNVSKLKPSDPIKYLGEFLLEKSKSYKP